jgi:hypothetical protein
MRNAVFLSWRMVEITGPNPLGRGGAVQTIPGIGGPKLNYTRVDRRCPIRTEEEDGGTEEDSGLFVEDIEQ